MPVGVVSVDAASATRGRTAIPAMALVFMSFAMPAALLGVIWPEVRARFGQSLGALGVVGLLYGLGRMSTCVSGRWLIHRIGMGRAMGGTTAALVIVCALTAMSPSWVLFLGAVVALGMVSGTLDSLGATFITRLGDLRKTGLIQGSYGVGSTVGPAVAAVVSSWRVTLGVTVVWASFALVAVARVRSGWPAEPHVHHAGTGAVTPLSWRVAAVALGLYTAFVGLEVTMGTWSHTYLTDQRGLGTTWAAVGVSAFWGGMTVGRLSLSRVVVARLVGRLGLRFFAGAALGLLAPLALLPPVCGVGTLLLLGLALAPVIPSLMSTTAARLGAAHAPRFAGYQLLAANVGAIGAPSLTGALVGGVGPGVVIVVCVALAGSGLALLTRANA